MDTEEFESLMLVLVRAGLGANAVALRARDAAQRKALARVEAEAGRLAEAGLAAHVKATTVQAQLAEAVDLLRYIYNHNELALYENGRIEDFLARDAQVEQQEALSDAELMEVAMFEGSGNKAARRAHELGAADLPERLAPKQDAQGAQAGDEQSAFLSWAEREYQTGPDEELNLKHVDVIQNRKGWMARAALATQPEVPEQYEYWCIAFGRWKPIQELVEFLTSRGFKVRAVRGAEHE